jgi:7-cyano-7-deazaguanine synthase
MATAVLLSGGLDSVVLLAEEAAVDVAQPIYVNVGLAWERAERLAIARLLASGRLGPRIKPLASLSVDMTDVYPAVHWARTGAAPGYNTPDEDVYIPGRNIVLLGKAAVFCAAADIARLVIGTLNHNPFPDATPEFRETFASALSLGLAHRLEIAAPYSRVEKSEVIKRAAALGVPLEFTLSCMNPVIQGDVPRHCGVCSKCRERHDAFLDAGIADPTEYIDRQYVSEGRSGN